MKTPKEKLDALRAEIAKDKLDGFIVPHADEFLSEYLPANAERLAWLTGFTGSSGDAVILEDKAVAMTNGIYAIQIRKQVDLSLYEVTDNQETTIGDWLSANAKPKAKVGFDPRLHTRKQIEQISDKVKEKNIELVPVLSNPVDRLWKGRPAPPLGVVELFPDDIAGATSHEKRTRIAADLAKEKIRSAIITKSDSICWLLNVRGDDIPYNPLVLSNLVLYNDGKVDWYVNPEKIPPEVKKALGEDVRLHSPEHYEEDLKKLKGPVQVDPQRSPLSAEIVLKSSGVKVVDGKDPCVLPKSLKTPSEQLAIKQTHIRDAVAVVHFLYWLDCQDFKKETHTEISLAEKLEEFRRGQNGYRGPSFATISGWADNGAIIHYHATEESNKKITGNNFYLLDSGGQYEFGTTDITRTIAIGKISDVAKAHYTRVLKGHIAVASAVMDDTMTGAMLDALARAPLKEAGLDYAHGTGHGVGCMLAVHEEATYISAKITEATFKPGMLLSNEPGFYLENHYGIRLENLMLCHDNGDGRLCWETVTLVPFDLRAVDWELMNEEEHDWLMAYHTGIFNTLSPFLYSEALDWLHEFCFSYFKN